MSQLSKSLAIFCACTVQFVPNLFENHIVGFPMMRLISYDIRNNLIKKMEVDTY